MFAHKKTVLALLLSLPLLMAADCGHGGGSPCPPRAGEAFSDDDAPDAGAGIAAEGDPADEARAVGTGGSTGGGGPEECRRE
ncbi:MAG TPA: hypothetical protein VL426_04805 [Candidatus Binatia bacterium]|jgi:hypothetical protein|nr:hypothetical protein [Candidatus Binatia bacterium]